VAVGPSIPSSTEEGSSFSMEPRMPRCGATFDENSVPLGQGGLQGVLGRDRQPGVGC